MRIIGAADEFWRLRLTRVDTTTDVDFEWHDDILYREPLTRPVDDVEWWAVEAIRVDDYDAIVRLGAFELRESAEAFFERAREDLTAMSKTQFEDTYLSVTPKTAGDSEEPAR